MSGIPDLDQYGEQCPSVVTFEPQDYGMAVTQGNSLRERVNLPLSRNALSFERIGKVKNVVFSNPDPTVVNI